MKMTVDELTRMAFVWAEQDRASLAEAWGYGTPEAADVKSELKQLHDYRMKRWGKTKLESMLQKPHKTVSISELKKTA